MSAISSWRAKASFSQRQEIYLLLAKKFCTFTEDISASYCKGQNR